MTKLTNKAEFIRRYVGTFHASAEVYRKQAEEEWSRLCRAGLAEEQREPGPYWVKWYPESRWTLAVWREGIWLGLREHGTGMVPTIVGRNRIEPPKDDVGYDDIMAFNDDADKARRKPPKE